MNIKELDEYWINTDLKSFIQEIVFGWCSSWWCRHWSEASANIQLQLNRCDIVTRIDGELILQLLQGGITQILHHNYRKQSFIIHLLPVILSYFYIFCSKYPFFTIFCWETTLCTTVNRVETKFVWEEKINNGLLLARPHLPHLHRDDRRVI